MRSGAALFHEWLEKRGYKQNEAAKLLGISEGLVSMLRSGERLPGRNLSAKLWEFAGIPVGSWVLSPDDIGEAAIVGKNGSRKSHRA